MSLLDLAAVLAGLLAVSGAVVGVVGVVGTTRPPRPPSALQQRARRWWVGPGRTRREQRNHQVKTVAAVVAGALTWLLTGWPAAGAIIGIAVPGIPWLFAAGRAEKQAIARLEAVEAWTRRLADIVARGIGLQQAVVATAATAPQLVEQEIRDLAARLQAGGDPIVALQQLADDLDDYTADQVIAPLMLHVTDRGEGLHEVLTGISRSIAAEIEMRSTIDAKREGSRFAVRFLTGMTILLLAYGMLNPHYLQPYGSALGQLVLVFLAGLYVALMTSVRRLSLPPRRERLLPPADTQTLGAAA
ncbi:Flp pilus assembly protein TadB [Micromonospora purpureochromogenes]|uniref:Flp pilus assembly protein TadB n=1 Tax=Micromonospora purpureochromogenes TaxID=47872 RepID=A0A1C4Z8F9_9ACTN|nr:type II secretion system F family protein [Micromonospora purpureochromogenes]SCF29184.1 Flp pilus assembly protein TadB [Micromonospora purpureochromogenes]